jgi:hypothetical protein
MSTVIADRFSSSSRLSRRAVRPSFGRMAAFAMGWGAAVILMFFSTPGQGYAGELGAFFAPTAVAAYETGPRQGPKIVLRPHVAYVVVGLAWDTSERLWLQLRDPESLRIVRGEGWTPLNSQELNGRSTMPVAIYAQPMEPGQALPKRVFVPAADVQASGEGEPGKAFPYVRWRHARYSARRAMEPWVTATQGVYRAGRSPAFVMGVYQDLQQHRVPLEGQKRLMAGIVRVGDTAQEARWAWGDPLRTWQEGADAKKVTVWSYLEGQLRFDGDTVKDVR